jgi:branched-chain amino acid transport system substrate-binding protein
MIMWEAAQRRIKRAIACSLLAIGIAACGGSSGTPGVTGNTIVFGQTVPMSGPAALYGESAAGVQAYFDMVNAHGGIDDRRLELVSVDDLYDPPVSVEQTQNLLKRGEFAEVAVNGSASVKAVLPLLTQAGVPLVGPQSGAAFLFDNTPRNVFTVWPEYTVEGRMLGGFAQRLALRRVGVLYQDDAFGRTLYSGVLQSGLRPAKVIAYDPTQTDFAQDARAFKDAGVDGVLILAIPQPTIRFLNSLADIGFRPVRIMTQVAATPATFAAAPREFPGSYVGSFMPPLDPSSSDSLVRQFEQAMREYEPGAPISEFAAWGWMEAQVAVAGLQHAQGQLTRAGYIEGLERVENLQTLGGTVSYTAADHHGLERMFMLQARDGRFVATDG